MIPKCPVCGHELKARTGDLYAALFIHIDDVHSRDEIVDRMVSMELSRAAREAEGLDDE